MILYDQSCLDYVYGFLGLLVRSRCQISGNVLSYNVQQSTEWTRFLWLIQLLEKGR